MSCLRAFKHHGLGLQVRRGGPAGQCPRSRLRRWGVVRAVVRPPRLIDASRVRQLEAEEVFDLRERQDHRVRVSIVQVLVQRLIFAPALLVLPVDEMAHRAHATSHHHPVRTSPHRRSPVARVLVKPCRRPSSRDGTMSSGSWSMSTDDGHVRGVRSIWLGSDNAAKVGPVGAHPRARGATRTLAGSVLE